MKTDDLIARLAENVAVVPRHALERRILIGLALGCLVSLAMVAAGLGLRPDLSSAVGSFPFWMKWAYTASLGVCASVAATRLARPERFEVVRLWPILVPLLGILLVCAVQMERNPVGAWLSMWLGASWTSCPWIICALSVPIFLGLLWSFKRLAATQLRTAGGAAGFAAGSWSAVLYCLHCPEVSALFVATWYTLGIAVAAGVGALVGPRALRW